MCVCVCVCVCVRVVQKVLSYTWKEEYIFVVATHDDL